MSGVGGEEVCVEPSMCLFISWIKCIL